jgi:rod shape-determining protein MreC
MNTNLWDQVRDWVLLGSLLLASLFVLLTRNDPAVRALRAGALEVTAQVESSFAWAARYFRALEENDELRRQNIQLSSTVARTRAARMRNQELQAMLNLRDTSSLRLQAARIVEKDITKQQNYFTINVGASDSVAAGMAVINEDGILGKVVLTSADYARVMPYLNTDFRVPGVIVPLRAEGIVRWEGQQLNRLLMEHVVKTEPVSAGQSVVTSGHSGVFPAGHAIGTIDSVIVQPGRNELRIHLRPAAPLYKARHAFVVMERPDPERVALQERSVQ